MEKVRILLPLMVRQQALMVGTFLFFDRELTRMGAAHSAVVVAVPVGRGQPRCRVFGERTRSPALEPRAECRLTRGSVLIKSSGPILKPLSGW
jgi:hypothetical protein